MDKELSYITLVKDLDPDDAVEYLTQHCGDEEEDGEYMELVQEADDDTTLGDLVDFVQESHEVQEHDEEQAAEGDLGEEEL